MYLCSCYLGLVAKTKITIKAETRARASAYFYLWLKTYRTAIDKNKILECNKQKNELSKIVIFQLLIQLPLFIGLSCDYGRTIPMSIYTSFFLFHFSNEKGIKLNVTNIINKVSDKIMNIFNFHSIFSNAWVYIVLILVFPFHTFIPSLINDNIIIHSLDKIFKYIL